MEKQYHEEELELGKVHHTMVDMTLYDEEQNGYIIDFKREDNKFKIFYADGKVNEMESCSLHNLNFYRYRAENQFYQFYDKFMDQVGLESFKTYCKKYGSVILSLVGMYFLYNFDIHIIIKILISIGVVCAEVFYYFLQHYDLLVLSQEIDRVEALDLYFKNKREFLIQNQDEKEDDYSLSVEDVWQNDLKKEEVAAILEDAKKNKGLVLKYDVKKYKKSLS